MEETIPTYSYEEDQASYTLENEDIKFSLDPSTTYFEIIDKSNNATWTSNPVDGANDSKADEQSKKNLRSTLIIEYGDSTGIKTLYNVFQYSIEKGNYQVSQQKDAIQVDYTIGDLQKVYYIPTAVPISRMKIFMDKMDSGSQRQVNSYYRKIDINNLRPTDNKEELLAKYPDLANEVVYELRDGTQEYLKEKIQTIFSDAGYTVEDYEEDLARYSGQHVEEKPYFNVSIIYRLEENNLVVEIPFDRMQWKPEYPITKIEVLPYLGAGSTRDEGYILVPEGNGGIITFNNNKSEQNPYYAQVYGWDYGEQRDSMTDENDATFPVFGISKNGSSMLCILEDYASVADIRADVSGRMHSYNYADATYTTLHDASLKMSAKTDRSVIWYEKQKPTGSIRQRYCFLDTGSYAKMSEAYRNYLMDQYPQLKKKSDVSTPVYVTLIGAVDEVKQRFGFPLSVPVALTTYKDAYDILDDLQKDGYDNLSVRYRGWMNGGLKQTSLSSVSPLNELGIKSRLTKLLRYGVDQGVPIYLDGMVENVYHKNPFDGFMINRDAAKYSSRQVVKLYDFTPVYYGLEDWNDCYYFVKPQLTVSYMKNLAEYAKKNSAGVSFGDIGNILGANYDPKNLTTRQQVIEMQQKELEGIASEGTDICVTNGNDYVLPYVDFITDMDLIGYRYQIMDYMVPFYSMAIHGLVDYSGVSLNLAGNYQEMVLKSAEAGAGLSFTYMKKDASVLQDSNYTFLFAAEYDKWKENAYSIYIRYQKDLGHCFNQFITDHMSLADGVFVTSYEDGTKVYVNYNHTDFVQDGFIVPARDYIVEGR
jgi:ElaB/YqjD/DUF883 family membrane-anchored ribosome-binding protein